MTFDPFGIEAYHEDVRQRIARGEEGLAQSDVSGATVSFDADGHPGSITYGPYLSLSATEILDEMIVDVARGEGVASNRTFDRDRVRWMIADRRKYPARWTKKHKQADDLEAYYFQGQGEVILK